VAAVDKAGNIGPLSSSKSATTKSDSGSGSSSNSKLSKVTGLSVKAKNDVQLDLKWSKLQVSNIDHYNIYRSKSSKFTVTLGVTEPVAKSSGTSYSDKGLTPNTKYYYKVAAVDADGKIGPLSDTKSGTTMKSSSTSNVKSVQSIPISELNQNSQQGGENQLTPVITELQR
jgi:fibronectin type 3 domain-containing protein